MYIACDVEAATGTVVAHRVLHARQFVEEEVRAYHGGPSTGKDWRDYFDNKFWPSLLKEKRWAATLSKVVRLNILEVSDE